MDIGNAYDLGMAFYASLHKKTFNVYRPDYTRADSLETQIASSVKMRANTIGQQYAQKKYSGLDLYTVITGLRESLQEGDVIVETKARPNVPGMTIYSMNETEDIIASRTGRVGRLVKDINTSMYTNVRFDFFSKHNKGTPMHSDMAGSLYPGGVNVFIYPRSGVDVGWRLVDDQSRIWRIDAIEEMGYGLILDCSRDDS